MKLQLVLVAVLAAAALSAPLEMIDPDCIEEEIELSEPAPEINAEFAINVPDLRLDFGNDVDTECEEDLPEAAPPAPTTEAAECEEELPTPEAAPAMPEATEAEECEEELPEIENAPEIIMTDAPEPTGTEECVDEDW